MAYSNGYFELQLLFAKKVSLMKKEPLPETLLGYTSFYKTFRIRGWEFSREDETWRTFLDLAQKSKDLSVTIYDFYLERIKKDNEESKKESFGCFSFEFDKKYKCISIHFRNMDKPNPGALSKERVEARKKELKEMFFKIKRKYPDVKKVCGFSWLYNIEAYIRLFPKEYLKNHKVVTDWFKSSALWGQFLDSAGELKKDFVESFLKKIKKANNMKELRNSFPLKILEPSANIDHFYKYYGV